jgi:FkbM family methyltransferase
MYRFLKDSFKSLQYFPILWIVVAVAATIHQSIKSFSIVLIYRDMDGDWLNRRNKFIICSPDLNVESLSEIKERVDDLWLYDYKISDGDTVIDIGAGIGDDLIYFSSLVGEEGHVVAIEAHPITFRCLQKTIKYNELTNVTSVQLALSDTNKDLVISSRDNHLENTLAAVDSHEDAGAFTIPAKTLDSFLIEQKIEHINFVKMNIEGMELDVLLAGQDLFKGDITMVISCHDFIVDRGDEPESFKTFDGVHSLLSSSNFKITVRAEHKSPEVLYYIYATNID